MSAPNHQSLGCKDQRRITCLANRSIERITSACVRSPIVNFPTKRSVPAPSSNWATRSATVDGEPATIAPSRSASSTSPPSVGSFGGGMSHFRNSGVRCSAEDRPGAARRRDGLVVGRCDDDVADATDVAPAPSSGLACGPILLTWSATIGGGPTTTVFMPSFAACMKFPGCHNGGVGVLQRSQHDRHVVEVVRVAVKRQRVGVSAARSTASVSS